MRVRALAILAASVTPILVGGGCSSEPPPAVVLSPGLHVLDARTANAATVSDGALTFPAAGNDDLLARQPGDTVSSGYGSTTIFLRKVLGARRDGDTIVLDTAPAALADAIQSGDAHLDFGTVDVAPAAESVAPTDFSGGLPNHVLDLSGWRIDESGNPREAGGINVKIQPTGGHIRFSPHVSGDISIRDNQLTAARIVADVDLDESLDIAAQLEFLASVSHNWVDQSLVRLTESSNGVRQWEFPLWDTTRPVWAWIAGFPIYIELELKFTVGCFAGVDGMVDVTAGESFQDHLRFGVEYAGGDWQGIGEQSASFQPRFATTGAKGALFAKCYVQPRLDVKLFKLGGPFFLLNLYAKPQISAGIEHIDVPACAVDAFVESKVDVGLDGQAGVKFDPFDLHKVKYEAKVVLFDKFVEPIDEKGETRIDASGFCDLLTSSAGGSGGSSGGGSGSGSGGSSGSGSGGGSGGSSGGGSGGSSGSGSGGSSGSGAVAPVLPCGAGTNPPGADNGTCGGDGRVYYCYQNVWRLKDDCLAKGQRCQVAPSGSADSCVSPPFGAPVLPCGAGDNAGPANGTCGSDGRVYYCYQNVWRLKDDCVAKHEGCTIAASGVADYCQ